jgi:diacylglycerol kinase family enzyme
MSRSASKPAALLLINPRAGRLDRRTTAEVVAALGAGLDLDVRTTAERDEAIGMAAAGAAAGVPLVIALGGDGHVNEVANGLAGTTSALGIVPGGTMNVFARALGIPGAPAGAAAHLLAAGSRPHRRLPLGQIDDRYFTSSAGCGFDAEAAERVERRNASKRRFGELFFYWSALRVLMSSYRRRAPTMVLRDGFGEVAVSMAIASNCRPYAYFAGRSVDLTPGVTLEGGLGVFSMRSMRLEALPSYVWRVAVRGDVTGHEDVFWAADLEGFELHSERSFHRHVDGEPLPPAMRARFRIAPGMLEVQA